MKTPVFLIAPLLAASLFSVNAAPEPAHQDLQKINNIVVIYLENHSFDNLYGQFPGAEGIANAHPDTLRQVDLEDEPYEELPRVMDTRSTPPVPDKRFPEELPNRPFKIDQYLAIGEKTGDLVHRFYQHKSQINGGKLNRFAAMSDAGALTMGYYDGSKLPLWEYAKRYTLMDHFFQAAFGGSFLNHMWLACACTPRFEHPPKENIIQLNSRGEIIRDGAITPDGFAVNTLYPTHSPHAPSGTDRSAILHSLHQPTLGDRLTEKGVSWAWYGGGWNDAIAGHPDPSFQFHHHPYAYFERYADHTSERKAHLKDGSEFIAAIDQGNLPAVSFFKPLGSLNEHPGYADVLSGDQQVADILARIEKSSQWPGTVVIVTYDEFGGFWDHVPPPKGDRWGPGSRVPAILISPFSRAGGVNHDVYDMLSILKFIETRFDIKPLAHRDGAAKNLAKALKLPLSP